MCTQMYNGTCTCTCVANSERTFSLTREVCLFGCQYLLDPLTLVPVDKDVYTYMYM